jgi:hypothetical protein
MKTDILEIRIVEKSLSHDIFSSYCKLICLKFPEVGKSLSLESDDYENFIMENPPIRCLKVYQVKRMRKSFIKEARVWGRLFWPQRYSQRLSSVPLVG